MKSTIRLLAGLIGLTVLSSPALAFQADDPTQLVAELSHPEYHRRESAHERLAKLGNTAKQALLIGQKSKDSEVSLRSSVLLQEIRRQELWEPSVFRMGPGKATIRTAFEELARQTGNPVNWRRSSMKLDDPIELDGKPRPYWEAVDYLCQKSHVGLNFYDDPAGEGGVLTIQEPGLFPTSVVGPFRLRLQSLSRVLRQDIHFGDAEPDIQDSWSLSFVLHWEQRAAACRYRGRLQVMELRTDAGEDLRPQRSLPYREVLMPVMARTRSIPFTVNMNPPTKPAKRISSMRLAVELGLAGDFTDLELPVTAVGQVASTEGYRMTVERFNPQPKGSTLGVRLFRAEPLDVSVSDSNLVDELVSVTQESTPVRFSQTQVFGSPMSVGFTFVFDHPPDAQTKVRCRVPKIRSNRVVEFSFKDVVLP